MSRRLHPSAAGVWSNCPGSVKMQAEAPSYADPHSGDEGTAAHWAAAQIIEGNPVADGDLAPNGLIITEELLLTIQPYIDDVKVKAIGYPRHVEESVPMTRLGSGVRGNVDCWVYDDKKHILYIWDLKYGWTLVEVFENWQFMSYALGLLDKLKLDDNNTWINMRVAQPRPFHRDGSVRSWYVKAVELREYFSKLVNAAKEALGDNPSITSGSHCRYCTARYACPAAHKSALIAIDITETSAIDTIAPEHLGVAIEVLKRASEAVKYRLTGLETQAIAYLQSGKHVDGWALDRTQGHKAWTRPTAEVLALGDVMGVELRADIKLITPTQAETKGLSKELVGAYSDRPTGATKLKPVGKTKANKAFGSGVK